MSANNDTRIHAVRSVAAQDRGVCPSRKPASPGGLYNADLLEEIVEERFELQEDRRMVKARHSKRTRRLSQEDCEDRN